METKEKPEETAKLELKHIEFLLQNFLNKVHSYPEAREDFIADIEKNKEKVKSFDENNVMPDFLKEMMKSVLAEKIKQMEEDLIRVDKRHVLACEIMTILSEMKVQYL